MQPDKVKRITELPGGWVGAMIAICKEPVLIKYETSAGAAVDISIAPIPTVLVFVCKVLIDDRRNVISSAERSNDPWFFCWVLLLSQRLLELFVDSTAHRP